MEELNISDEEKALFERAFEAFDENGDGKIDANELKSAFEGFGQKRRQSSIIRMIDSVSEGRGGAKQQAALDLQEFLFLVKTNENDERMKSMFRGFQEKKQHHHG